ncbi:MAG: hypothetical protein H6797_00320 [Candidatus Nomurabacteria bacterium]|nr:MAG: hypothetical protein H6797_00320 [Candidatus Nomurabacteria bacterium]
MIEQTKLPTGWDYHHTLYPRRGYKSGGLTNDWRESPAMIVPMRRMRTQNEHQGLHDDVPPEPLPSDALAGYALRICEELEQEEITALQAFKLVRDELYNLSVRRSKRELGHEAVRFVRFFDLQRKHMCEVPLPGI